MVKATAGGCHAAIMVATSQAAYAMAPYYLRPGGTMVAVGAPKVKPVFKMRQRNPSLIYVMDVSRMGKLNVA